MYIVTYVCTHTIFCICVVNTGLLCTHTYIVGDIDLPYTSDWLLVCLEGVYNVHVGLPVLDPPPVVTGDKPILIVAEQHATKRTVMTLTTTRKGSNVELVNIPVYYT